MSDPMFVRISNPTQVRKDLLKSALDSTSLIKHFNSIKEIRDEKSELIEDLKIEMEKIKKLTSSAEKKLPKVHEEKSKKDSKHKKIEKKEVKEHKKRDTEEENLASEIMDIEKKLRSL